VELLLSRLLLHISSRCGLSVCLSSVCQSCSLKGKIFKSPTPSQNTQLLTTSEKKRFHNLPGGSVHQRFRFLPNYFGACSFTCHKQIRGTFCIFATSVAMHCLYPALCLQWYNKLVVLRVYWLSVKRRNNIRYTTDRRRPWNKCRPNHCLECARSFSTYLSHPRQWFSKHLGL